MAAKQWTKRPKPGKEPEAPGWMATIDSATPPRAALLGAALSGANPKNLALTLAAAASIAEAGLDDTDTAIAVAVFTALGSITSPARSSSTSSRATGPPARSPRSSSSWPTTTR